MKFTKKILQNGLTILHEKRDIPVTTVMLACKYGSAHESESEKGIAHFIEHMCFKGTKKRTTKQIAFELEKIGGILNAFTSEETTGYHVKLPSRYLKTAIEVLSDIYFNSTFPEEEIKKESNVICEEIKLHKDNPRRYAINKIKEKLYSPPFGLPIIGKAEIVKKISREKLIEKHAKIYTPENTILCIVGNNNIEEIIKIAKENIIKENKGKSIVPKIIKINSKETETRKGIEQTNIAIGFHFPNLIKEERYAADIFSVILGQGMSSKLFTEIREKEGLCYDIRTIKDEGKNYSYLLIYIGTNKENKEKAISLSIEQFKKMKNLTKQELEETKKQIIGNSEVESENSENVAISLIIEEIEDKAENHYKYKTRIQETTLEQIQKLANTENYSEFVLEPL